jgi:hypothetical protein
VIALSDAPVAEIDLHRIAPELKQPVTRADFDQSIRKLVGKTVSTVQAMLKTAGVAAEAVDTILFACGSSGVPLLREQLAQVLPSACRVEGDLLGGIGAGLARDAARQFGGWVERLRDGGTFRTYRNDASGRNRQIQRPMPNCHSDPTQAFPPVTGMRPSLVIACSHAARWRLTHPTSADRHRGPRATSIRTHQSHP